MPNRHVVLVRPLESPEDLQSLPVLAYLAGQMFEKGPGSITETVFWFRRNDLIPIECDLNTSGLQLHGPAEVLSVMKSFD